MFYEVIKKMDFITTTKIAREGKKAFSDGCKVVLYNNQDIWMIRWKDFYDAIKDSGIIEQIKEELWESKDKTTQQVLEEYEEWKRDKSISLDDFRKKYGV